MTRTNILFWLSLTLTGVTSMVLQSGVPSARQECEPSVERQHIACGQKGARCYSGPFFSDSCDNKLACKVSTVGLGAIWDDGVYGTCKRKPRRSVDCTKCKKNSKRLCFLPQMTEYHLEQITVNVPDRYFVTCRCYKKCISEPFPKLSDHPLTPTPSPSFNPDPVPCRC